MKNIENVIDLAIELVLEEQKRNEEEFDRISKEVQEAKERMAIRTARIRDRMRERSKKFDSIR